MTPEQRASARILLAEPHNHLWQRLLQAALDHIQVLETLNAVRAGLLRCTRCQRVTAPGVECACPLLAQIARLEVKLAGPYCPKCNGPCQLQEGRPERTETDVEGPEGSQS